MSLRQNQWMGSFVALLVSGLMLGCGSGDQPSPTNKPGSPNSSGTASTGNESTSSTDSDTGDSTDESEVITEGWGNLTGRFVMPNAPEPEGLDAAARDEFCGKFKLLDEAITVNSENQGLANVVIWLYIKRGEEIPVVHESYAAVAESPALIDNVQCRFEPRVVTLLTNQTLDIKNSDEVGHNTNIAYDPAPVNRTVPIGATINYDKLTQPTRLPAKVACNIHPWMKAWLLVQDTPYVAVTDKDGKFSIENLPAGEWEFQVWHEASGYVSNVKLGGEINVWGRGRFKRTINGGDNTVDLGEIEVSASDFSG